MKTKKIEKRAKKRKPGNEDEKALSKKKGPGKVLGAVAEKDSDIIERKQAESQREAALEAMVKSENRFRSIFESSRDAIMTLEPPYWKFTSGNPAALKMFMAKDEADFASHEPWAMSPEQQPDGRASAEKAKEMIEIAMRDGSNFFEWTHKRLNGEEFPATVLLTRMVLVEKTLIQATVRDITERKRAELQKKEAIEALRRSEENFRRSLEDSPLGVRVVTAAGETIYANRQLFDIYGYDNVEELNKISLKERYTPQSHAEFQIRKKDRERGDFGPSEYEINIVGKNKEIRHLLVLRKEVLWNGTKQFQVIYQDITERKQAESEREDALAALRKSEEKFRKIFEEQAAVKLLIEPESGAIVDANKAAEQYYGWTRAELKRMYIHQINTLSAEQVNIEMEKVRKQKRSHFEFLHRRADGSIRDVEVFSSKIEMAGKDILHSIIHDITDRKRAESQREAALKEIRRKAKELREKNEELERFTYSVSHDLKSPLVTILTFLGHLEQDMAGMNKEQVKQDLGYIRIGAEKMSRLLDELLALSQVGRKIKPPEEVPLQTIVKEASGLVAGRITERGVEVKVTKAEFVLWGDRVRLVEVFQNLLDNACKFMGEQKSPLVEIGVETKDGEAVIFVRDNGIGITSQFLPKLFIMFEKLNRSTEGDGIGLALVKRIVEVHVGRIWVESEGPGQGTTFYFTLGKTCLQKTKENQ